MKLPFQLAGTLLVSAAMTACGGGGGNPGTCHGSPEVCAEGQETRTPPPANTNTGVTGATNTTNTTTGSTGTTGAGTGGGNGSGY